MTSLLDQYFIVAKCAAANNTHKHCAGSWTVTLLVTVWSPDGAAGAVRVHGSHSTNPGTHRWIFIHIHEVVIRGEDRRLVHVADDDSHRGGMFEWSQVRETSVHLYVEGVDVERVDFPPLVVEALQRLRQEEQWTAETSGSVVGITQSKESNNWLLSKKESHYFISLFVP